MWLNLSSIDAKIFISFGSLEPTLVANVYILHFICVHGAAYLELSSATKMANIRISFVSTWRCHFTFIVRQEFHGWYGLKHPRKLLAVQHNCGEGPESLWFRTKVEAI